MYSKVSGIYCIEDKRGYKYYGSAVNIKQRWALHISQLKRNIHENDKLQHAWNRYGENFFSFYIVEIVKDINILLEREQYWIDRNLTENVFVYNLRTVAESNLGLRWSRKSRAKMSKARKGVSKSLEHKQKIAEAHRGKPKNVGRKDSEAVRRNNSLSQSGGKVYSFRSPDGTLYAGICNIAQFAREQNLYASGLRGLVNGKLKTHKGFTFVSMYILERASNKMLFVHAMEADNCVDLFIREDNNFVYIGCLPKGSKVKEHYTTICIMLTEKEPLYKNLVVDIIEYKRL